MLASLHQGAYGNSLGYGRWLLEQLGSSNSKIAVWKHWKCVMLMEPRLSYNVFMFNIVFFVMEASIFKLWLWGAMPLHLCYRVRWNRWINIYFGGPILSILCPQEVRWGRVKMDNCTLIQGIGHYFYHVMIKLEINTSSNIIMTGYIA